jgi:hypothetical protein
MSAKEPRTSSSPHGKRESNSESNVTSSPAPSERKERKTAENKEKSSQKDKSKGTETQPSDVVNETGESAETDEEVEVIVDKEGPLSMLKSKHWKELHFTLSGSALYARKHEGDLLVTDIIKLNGCKIEESGDKKKSNSFSLVLSSGDRIQLAAADEPSMRSWIEAINENKDKEIGTLSQGAKKKQSRLMRLKKNLGGKVATSHAGKAMIRDFVGPDIEAVLETIKKVIELVDGKKKATEVENNIIKISVKVILLWENKEISVQELIKPRELGRELWSLGLDMLEISFAYDFAKLSSSIDKVGQEVHKILSPYITEKNLKLFDDTVKYLRSEPLVSKLYTSDECEEHRKILHEALRKLWNQYILNQPVESDKPKKEKTDEKETKKKAHK